jgi:hypothetical protein
MARIRKINPLILAAVPVSGILTHSAIGHHCSKLLVCIVDKSLGYNLPSFLNRVFGSVASPRPRSTLGPTAVQSLSLLTTVNWGATQRERLEKKDENFSNIRDFPNNESLEGSSRADAC